MNIEQQRQEYIDRPMPSSPESESTILGAVILDNAIMGQIPEYLQPDDFYVPLNRMMFEVMRTLSDAGKPIDPILMAEEFRKMGILDAMGGTPAIMKTTFGLPHFSDVQEYIKVVKDHSNRRKLIRECNRIITEGLVLEQSIESLFEDAEHAIYNISSQTETVQAVLMSDEVGHAIQASKGRALAGSAIIGLPTGLTSLDNKLQGYRNKQYVIIAARPSIGKTSLVTRKLYKMATLYQAPCLLFSLEMAKTEIADRVITAEVNIDGSLLRSGHLSDEQWAEAEHVRSSLAEENGFFINDSPFITTRTIRSEVRRVNATLRKKGQRLKVIAIDHVGLMNNASEKRGRSREGEISEISRTLKQIAREFDCVVMVLSQLNRKSEERQDKRPTLSDLRESGSLEQDADIVLLLYREDAYQNDPSLHTNIAEVIIAKNRNGPTGNIKLHFNRKSTRFSDLSEAPEQVMTPIFGPGDFTL